jgi:hypothetical protein
VSHYLLGLRIFALTEEHIELWQRLTRSLGLVALVLLGAHLVSVFVVQRTSRVARYNLNRVVNLIAGITLALVMLAVLFADWYTTIVSFGLISVILGFALQKTNYQFYRMAVPAYTQAVRGRRPDSNRRSYRRCGRCRLFGYDALGVRWTTSAHGSSKRPDHR